LAIRVYPQPIRISIGSSQCSRPRVAGGSSKRSCRAGRAWGVLSWRRRSKRWGRATSWCLPSGTGSPGPRNLQGARPEVAGSHHADRSRHPDLPVVPGRGRASSDPGACKRWASCRQETRRKVRTQAEAGCAPGARSRPYGSRGGQKPARGRAPLSRRPFNHCASPRACGVLSALKVCRSNNDKWVLDPTRNIWSVGPRLPAARHHFAAAQLGGELLYQ
jgi:hypothetical protein